MNKILLIFVSIAIILGLALTYSVGLNVGNSVSLTGRSTWSGPINSENGYLSNGTEFIDSDGNVNVSNLVQGGGVTNITASSTTFGDTLTAANFCDSSIININTISVSTTDGNVSDLAGIWNIPTSTDLIADCLTTTGDTKTVRLNNAATSTYALTISQKAIATSFIDFFAVVTSTDAAGTTTVLDEGESALIILQNTNGVTTSASILHVQIQ